MSNLNKEGRAELAARAAREGELLKEANITRMLKRKERELITNDVAKFKRKYYNIRTRYNKKTKEVEILKRILKAHNVDYIMALKTEMKEDAINTLLRSKW